MRLDEPSLSTTLDVRLTDPEPVTEAPQGFTLDGSPSTGTEQPSQPATRQVALIGAAPLTETPVTACTQGLREKDW